LINGAVVPSPELTRSVIPLDLFPTSIVESIKIQKSPSPDVPAVFGGGMIDVRTLSVPKGPAASFNLGMGFNGISDDDGLVFNATGTPLPGPIAAAINTDRGNIGAANVLRTLRTSQPLASISDARAVQQSLMESLDTNVSPVRKFLDPDMSVRLALGNSWNLDEDWTFGVLVNANYGNKYRNQSQYR